MDVCLVGLDDLVEAIFAGRIQNPTMVGALAAHTAIRTGRVRNPFRDSPWPARKAGRKEPDVDGFRS